MSDLCTHQSSQRCWLGYFTLSYNQWTSFVLAALIMPQICFIRSGVSVPISFICHICFHARLSIENPCKASPKVGGKNSIPAAILESGNKYIVRKFRIYGFHSTVLCFAVFYDSQPLTWSVRFLRGERVIYTNGGVKCD